MPAVKKITRPVEGSWVTVACSAAWRRMWRTRFECSTYASSRNQCRRSTTCTWYCSIWKSITTQLPFISSLNFVLAVKKIWFIVYCVLTLKCWRASVKNLVFTSYLLISLMFMFTRIFRNLWTVIISRPCNGWWGSMLRRVRNCRFIIIIIIICFHNFK